MPGRSVVLMLALAAATLSACKYDVKVDANGFICKTVADCPSGYRCQNATAAHSGVCCSPDSASCVSQSATGTNSTTGTTTPTRTGTSTSTTPNTSTASLSTTTTSTVSATSPDAGARDGLPPGPEAGPGTSTITGTGTLGTGGGGAVSSGGTTTGGNTGTGGTVSGTGGGSGTGGRSGTGGASGSGGVPDAGIDTPNGGTGGASGSGGTRDAGIDAPIGGSGGASGTAGSGGGGAGGTGLTAPNCVGLPATCGLSGSDNCCTALVVPGGTFNRSNDSAYPATVSDFYLDKYEVTVGRFRAFVNAGMGTKANPPAVSAGAHPLITGTGWDSTWNSRLVSTTDALKTTLAMPTLCEGVHTWTDAAGANENLPIDCVTWYEAFAFCAWDGGRLATEAEWEYAAAGGSEQRLYPWGPTDPGPNTDLAVWGCYYKGTGTCSGMVNIAPVGSAPAGNGKWGQSDLAGSMWEWVFDWYAPYVVSCKNCADTTPADNRVERGGGFGSDASYLESADRESGDPLLDRGSAVGIRCARSKP